MVDARRIVVGLAVTLLLAACGRSGGGGAASNAPAAPTTPSIPVPSTLQGAGMTLPYVINSASASVSNGTIGATRVDPANLGTGGTITINTDANGNLNLLQFNIATPSSNFTNSYNAASIAPFKSLTLGELTTFLNSINTTAGASGAVTSLGSGSGLSASVYGIWASNDSVTSGRVGAFATGNQTSAASMPQTGTATYNGSTIGVAGSPSVNYAVNGSVQIQANFQAASVQTTISGLQFQNIANNVATNQVTVTGSNTLTGSGVISGNQYTGTLSGGILAGNSTGTFYGPAAGETAGIWRATGGSLSVIGSYGAIKQ